MESELAWWLLLLLCVVLFCFCFLFLFFFFFKQKTAYEIRLSLVGSATELGRWCWVPLAAAAVELFLAAGEEYLG